MPSTKIILGIAAAAALVACTEDDSVKSASTNADNGPVSEETSESIASSISKGTEDAKQSLETASTKAELNQKANALQDSVAEQAEEAQTAIERKKSEVAETVSENKEVAAAKIEEETSELGSQLEDAKESATEAASDATGDLKDRLASAVKEQASELVSKYGDSTGALGSQIDSLKSKYESMKDNLPESVTSAFSENLPTLEAGVEKLKEMVQEFSPETMEQLSSFKSKYQSQLSSVTSTYKELAGALAQAGMKLPGVQ